MIWKIVSTVVASLGGLAIGLWWIVSPNTYMRLLLKYRSRYGVALWPSPEQAASRWWRVALRILGIAALAFVALYYYAAYYDLSHR